MGVDIFCELETPLTHRFCFLSSILHHHPGSSCRSALDLGQPLCLPGEMWHCQACPPASRVPAQISYPGPTNSSRAVLSVRSKSLPNCSCPSDRDVTGTKKRREGEGKRYTMAAMWAETPLSAEMTPLLSASICPKMVRGLCMTATAVAGIFQHENR